MKRLHGSYGAANSPLEAEKSALRKQMRTLRKGLAKAEIWSADVWPAILQNAGETPADRGKVVAGYSPLGSEIDPAFIMGALVDAGWIPALPRAARRDGPLTFHLAHGPLTPDAFGIPAPPPTAPLLTPDLLLVPVLAFDRFGGRLGQGAGCYDRTIAALRAAGSVRAIGVAYSGQQVERVPTEDHDQRLDGILTDTEFIAVVDVSA